MKIYKDLNEKDEIIKLRKELMQKKSNSKSFNSSKSRNNSAYSEASRHSRSSSNISREIIRHINTDKGTFFEENIRNILEFYYNWQKLNINRSFFYRKLNLENDYYILTVNNEIKINIKNEEYYFRLKKNKCCEYKKKKNGKVKSIGNIDFEIPGLFEIEKCKDIEIDGIYNMEDIKFPSDSEVSILYKNIEGENNSINSDNDDNINYDSNNNDNEEKDMENEEYEDGENDAQNEDEKKDENEDDNDNQDGNKEEIENDNNNNDNSNSNMDENDNSNNESYTNEENYILSQFKYAIIEIKLSRKKIYELIEQIKKDKEVMEKLLKGKILYIGFINSESLIYDIKDELEGLNFILFGVRKSKFCGHNITQYIEWDSIKDIKSLKIKVNKINNRLNNMRKHIDDKFNNIDDRLKLIESQLNKIVEKDQNKKIIKRTTYLKKKKKRYKTHSKKKDNKKAKK